MFLPLTSCEECQGQEMSPSYDMIHGQFIVSVIVMYGYDVVDIYFSLSLRNATRVLLQMCVRN